MLGTLCEEVEESSTRCWTARVGTVGLAVCSAGTIKPERFGVSRHRASPVAVQVGGRVLALNDPNGELSRKVRDVMK